MKGLQKSKILYKARKTRDTSVTPKEYDIDDMYTVYNIYC